MQTETEIKQAVCAHYAAAARTGKSCCGTAGSTQGQPELGLDMIGDACTSFDGYVPDAGLGLGCGLPTQHAGIEPGNVVLDLGSGAGIDAFVARQIVGEKGRVIGVDMTPEMLARARVNAAKLGYDNVEFRAGEIEALPIEGASIDVVISNCVLNLAPDKARAFAEIFRVLRPGGHFCISDILATGPLPEPIRKAAALYVGCVAAALPRNEYLRLIGDARFEAIDVAETKAIDLPGEALASHLDGAELAAFRTSGIILQSITARAAKRCSGRE